MNREKLLELKSELNESLRFINQVQSKHSLTKSKNDLESAIDLFDKGQHGKALESLNAAQKGIYELQANAVDSEQYNVGVKLQFIHNKLAAKIVSYPVNSVYA